MKIILKNSNGVDKKPLEADLELGEVAINTVSGTMYSKIRTEQGDMLANTEFYNFVNSSIQPIFSVPNTAYEKDVIDITIDNYDANNDYYVRVTGGIIDTSSNPFKWTLPSVLTTSQTYAISISVKEVGKIESKPTPYQYIEVMNMEGVLDDLIYLDNSNIDTSDFDTLTNAELSNGEVHITDDNAIVESINFEQEDDDGDWTQVKPTVYIKHKNLLDTTNVTSLDLNSIKVTEDAPIDSGDIIYVKQDGEIKEVEVGTVENNIPFYEFEHISIGQNCTVFLDKNNKLFINGSFSYNLLSNLKFKKIELSPTSEFAYGITLDNELYVIGDNTNGELGLGDNDNRNSWAFAGVFARDIKCSDGFGGYLSTDNMLFLSGLNDVGQLGLGDNDNRNTFTKVTDLCTSYALGYKTIYVLKDNGLYVSGLNDKGQLGLGDNDNRNSLTSTNKEAYNVYIQDESGYFIDLSGKVYSTGSNDKYQLLLGDTTDRNEWTETTYTASELYVGTKSLYLVDTDDKLYSIGLNDVGQLGLGDTTDKTDLTEVNISLYKMFISDKSTILINLFKEVLVTGENQNNKFDLVSNSDVNSFTFSRKALVKSTVISNFTPSLSDNIDYEPYEVYRSIPTLSSSDSYHSIMIDKNGDVYTRGLNDKGQLGLGDNDNRTDWTFTGISNARTVATGYKCSYVVKSDKTLWSTGEGVDYKTGLNSTDDVNVFTYTGLNNVEKIINGRHTAFAITTDGSLYVAGDSNNGQSGLSTSDIKVFTKIPFREKVLEVSTSPRDTFIILENGDVYATGANYYGELGLGDTNKRSAFTKVFIKAKKVSSSYRHSVLLTMANEVLTTGNDYNGRLGNNSTGNKLFFSPISLDIRAVDIGAGIRTSFLISEDSYFYSCGNNEYGQLGLADTTDRDEFTNTNEEAKYILPGYDYCAVIIKEDGSVKATGRLGEYNHLYSDNTTGFIDLDIDLKEHKNTYINTTTTYKEYPELIYKKTLKTSVSATNDDTKDFNELSLEGVPTEAVNGLLYSYTNYDFSDDSKRKISLKAEGLLKNESIISVRLDLEKKD